MTLQRNHFRLPSHFFSSVWEMCISFSPRCFRGAPSPAFLAWLLLFRGMGFFGTLHPYSGADLVYRSRDLYKAVRVQ